MLTLLALAALALAAAEERSAELDRGWIGGATGVGPADSVLAELGFGFRVAAPSSAVGGAGVGPLSMHRLGWCLDAAREAAYGWDPELPPAAPPVLGPLDPAGLARLVDRLGLPQLPLPAGVSAAGGPLRVVAGGSGTFLVVAEGDLELLGAGTVEGAVIAAGRLRLAPGVEVVGGVRAVGFDAGGSASRVPEPERVEAALGALPECPVLVHFLGRLGRF